MEFEGTGRVVAALAGVAAATREYACDGQGGTWRGVAIQVTGGTVFVVLDASGTPRLWKDARVGRDSLPSASWFQRLANAPGPPESHFAEHGPKTLLSLGYLSDGDGPGLMPDLSPDKGRALDFCRAVLALMDPGAVRLAASVGGGNEILVPLSSRAGRACLPFLLPRPAFVRACVGRLGELAEALSSGRGDAAAAVYLLRATGHVRASVSDRRLAAILPAFEASGCRLVTLRNALSLLPPERMPRVPAQWRAFELLDRATMMYPDAARPDLLEAPGGDYVSLWQEVMASRLASDAVGEAADGERVGFGEADAFVSDNLMSRADEGVRQFMQLVLIPLFRAAGIDPQHTSLRGVASGMLPRGRKVAGLLRGYDRFHRVQVAIGTAAAGSSSGSWPSILPAGAVRANGLEIRCLTTAWELLEEGDMGPDSRGVPGMGHCVGVYSGACQARRSHILSIRRPGEEGRPYERVSTVELSVTHAGEVRLAQHSAHGNAPPPPEAKDAVRHLLGLFAGGSLAVPAEAMPSAGLSAGDVERRERLRRADEVLRAYAPLLRRDLRALDLPSFARAAWAPGLVRLPADHAAPGDLPAARRSAEGFAAAVAVLLAEEAVVEAA